MSNEYKIETIKDITDMITSENLESFMVDFEGFLHGLLLTRELVESKGYDGRIESTKFIWIDDGEHKIDFEIQEIKEQMKYTDDFRPLKGDRVYAESTDGNCIKVRIKTIIDEYSVVVGESYYSQRVTINSIYFISRCPWWAFWQR